MIIGTAGHIDHGKTALVRALTGVDTDRLKEEKARGISIELGYAYQPMADGQVLGFIDVPGHERFIHTMLAGAAGIDFALLVVAADDGVMPQTREHLDILALLDVGHGAVALSKVDRVDAARVAQVAAEIRALLAGTPLADAPVFPVAAPRGEGVEALRAHLHAAALAQPEQAVTGGFRLAVDRSFSLKGAGTVVTGTVFAGRVRVGDALTLTPAGRNVRLRGLHVMNQPAREGRAGQRCALNLAGIDQHQVARGDWIVAPALHAPATRLDVRLKLSRSAPRPLRHWAPVHLHLGAAHVMARVALLEGASLEPGAGALAQLVCEHPIAALWGDGFVVRDGEARHTLGGGRVLDPWGPARHRKRPERLAELAALGAADPAARLAGLVAAAPWGLDLERLALAWNQPQLARQPLAEQALAKPPLADHLPPGTRTVAQSALAYSASLWERHGATLLDGLARFHQQFPDELGPAAARARRMLLPQLPAPAFAALTEDLIAAGRLARGGPWLHLPAHRVTLGEAERALYQRLRPWLEAEPDDPPWVRELARRAGVEEAAMRRLMQKLARQGEVYQVVKDLFYLPESVARLAALLAALEREREQERDGIRAADFRDRSGIGRKRCIQILEFFDRVGYTRRVGEAHRLRNAEVFAK